MSTWACLASGPSLTPSDVALVKDKCIVVAVNSTWSIVPFCDHVYAADMYWWKNNAVTIPAKLWTCSPRAAEKYKLNLHRAYGESNSGLRAIQFAADQGATTILLLGYDVQATGGRLHHHADHPPGRNPDSNKFTLWRRQFRAFAAQLAKRNVKVVNCSRTTALDCFPRVDLEVALENI
jgi:hypothetical protein